MNISVQIGTDTYLIGKMQIQKILWNPFFTLQTDKIYLERRRHDHGTIKVQLSLARN